MRGDIGSGKWTLTGSETEQGDQCARGKKGTVGDRVLEVAPAHRAQLGDGALSPRRHRNTPNGMPRSWGGRNTGKGRCRGRTPPRRGRRPKPQPNGPTAPAPARATGGGKRPGERGPAHPTAE